MVASGLKGMGPLPAGTAVVAEAGQVTTEEGPLLQGAHIAHRILQVRINLNLQYNQNYHHNAPETIMNLNIAFISHSTKKCGLLRVYNTKILNK